MPLMVLSENMTRDGHQEESRLMQLSVELHICIRNQLITDPDSTLDELIPLRLVCKAFNDIWTPVVMTNMVLFPTGAPDRALAQLCHIIHGKSNASTLAACTTLTIKNLCCVDTDPDRWYSYARGFCDDGILEVLGHLVLELVMVVCWIIPFTLIITVSFIFVTLDAIINTKRMISTCRARYYMALLPRNFKMLNICRVRLFLGYGNSDWVIDRSTRILLSLPHLTELELGLADIPDIKYLTRCLKPLKGLHKLTVFHNRVDRWSLSFVPCIAALISSNENLTHFDWRDCSAHNFSTLFRNLPTHKPLKLHHLSFGGGHIIYDALIPHIRSLTSVESCDNERNWWCFHFSQARIFPPIIKVQLLDQELVTFIRRHPGLVSLSIGSRLTMEGTNSLCEALAHHSQTLQYLFFNSNILAIMLGDMESEANFLLSTDKLRELVLKTDETLQQYENATSRIYYEREVLPVVAQLSHSVTVIIRTSDKAIFFLCLTFCRDSENPLIRELAGRMVYEKVR